MVAGNVALASRLENDFITTSVARPASITIRRCGHIPRGPGYPVATISALLGLGGLANVVPLSLTARGSPPPCPDFDNASATWGRFTSVQRPGAFERSRFRLGARTVQDLECAAKMVRSEGPPPPVKLFDQNGMERRPMMLNRREGDASVP
jgi:hypothetical protein